MFSYAVVTGGTTGLVYSGFCGCIGLGYGVDSPRRSMSWAVSLEVDDGTPLTSPELLVKLRGLKLRI